MSTIELKVITTHSKWKPDSDGKYVPKDVGTRVDVRIFDFSNSDQEEQLRQYLRVIDRDFNPIYGAWDSNLTYVIPGGGISLKDVVESGQITREVLNRMVRYKREYPVIKESTQSNS